MLTNDEEILSFVEGFQIPLIQKPCQGKSFSNPLHESKGKKKHVEKKHLEVEDMLRKGTIPVFITEKGNI